jgi:Flp pilus assembly protein TadG
MTNRLRQFRHDERGLSYVFVAFGFMTFFAATTLAIDVGMYMTARTQAQNAADAGALAGATSLVYNSFDDREPDGPAVQGAVNAALDNEVMGHDVSVRTSDVTFPASPSGASDRVRVNVFRTADRSNPVTTLIGPVFGIPTVNIRATATAEASPANAVSCVKPFTIPDRWQENSSPPWDPENSTYDRYDKKGGVIPNADVYVPADQPGYTGYNAERDKGLYLMIRAGNDEKVAPSFYWSWAMPPGNGGSWYEQNIAGCNPQEVVWGQQMIQEPGNMVGPTNHGIDELIAQDPLAYWDSATKTVKSPLGGPSPRVFPVPVYDPEVYAAGQASGRGVDLRVANWIGFFVDKRVGNTVYGYVMPILGTYVGHAGPAPAAAFPKAIRLVQ